MSMKGVKRRDHSQTLPWTLLFPICLNCSKRGRVFRWCEYLWQLVCMPRKIHLSKSSNFIHFSIGTCLLRWWALDNFFSHLLTIHVANNSLLTRTWINQQCWILCSFSTLYQLSLPHAKSETVKVRIWYTTDRHIGICVQPISKELEILFWKSKISGFSNYIASYMRYNEGEAHFLLSKAFMKGSPQTKGNIFYV